MNQSYSIAWQKYRKLRFQVLILFLFFCLSPTLLGTLSIWLFGSTTPCLFIGIAVMIELAYSIWQLRNWPCPHCGNVFGMPMRQKCANCGLVTWSENPPGSDSI